MQLCLHAFIFFLAFSGVICGHISFVILMECYISNGKMELSAMCFDSRVHIQQKSDYLEHRRVDFAPNQPAFLVSDSK